MKILSVLLAISVALPQVMFASSTDVVMENGVQSVVVAAASEIQHG